MGKAIEIQELSKSFRLYQEKYFSLKERVVHAGHMPFEEFWALRDIDASFEPGQTVGMLGRNGSGKSTLLKCIAGILQPTSGRVVVRGKVAAMLELGAGFQTDLSGRENIYLNGTLLGMSRREIRHRFDEIVGFAELEQFIDNQVKFYSSGMVVRLGFSVAVSIDPDILLVDEVLAVGDERFQAKCLERVAQFQRDGRTIVVVSHAPDLLREMCDTILVLESGRVVTIAAPGEAIRTFREGLIEVNEGRSPDVLTPGVTMVSEEARDLRQIEITSATVEFPGSGERPYVVTGEPLTVRVEYDVHSTIEGADFAIEVLSAKSEQLFTSHTGSEEAMILTPGKGSVAFQFDEMPLLDGRYEVNVAVRVAGGALLATLEPAGHFEVMNPGKATGLVELPMRVEVVVPGSSEADRSRSAG